MSTELMPIEVSKCAGHCREVAIKLTERVGKLQAELQQLIDGGASLADINEKKAEIQETNTRINNSINKAVDLDAKAILDILVKTDVQDAIKTINLAKDRVNKAVKKINSIRRVLQYIDLFIRLAAAIVGAATTGSPPAQIKAIIGAIDTLYQTDFSDNDDDN